MMAAYLFERLPGCPHCCLRSMCLHLWDLEEDGQVAAVYKLWWHSGAGQADRMGVQSRQWTHDWVHLRFAGWSITWSRRPWHRGTWKVPTRSWSCKA